MSRGIFLSSIAIFFDLCGVLLTLPEKKNQEPFNTRTGTLPKLAHTQPSSAALEEAIFPATPGSEPVIKTRL
jgi:hypothetical protein